MRRAPQHERHGVGRLTRRPSLTYASRRALTIGLLLLAACSSGPSPTVPAVEEVSGPMPRLAGATLNGDTLDPSDYAGRVAVVNFWATTCAPCRREQPVLSALHDADSGGAFVIGVNYREGSAAARDYVQELGVAYPILRDADGSVATRFGVPFLPTTFVVDGNGQLRFRVTGEIDAETLRGLVERVSARS